MFSTDVAIKLEQSLVTLETMTDTLNEYAACLAAKIMKPSNHSGVVSF